MNFSDYLKAMQQIFLKLGLFERYSTVLLFALKDNSNYCIEGAILTVEVKKFLFFFANFQSLCISTILHVDLKFFGMLQLNILSKTSFLKFLKFCLVFL